MPFDIDIDINGNFRENTSNVNKDIRVFFQKVFRNCHTIMVTNCMNC
jgi:hypothetical protein